MTLSLSAHVRIFLCININNITNNYIDWFFHNSESACNSIVRKSEVVEIDWSITDICVVCYSTQPN